MEQAFEAASTAIHQAKSIADFHREDAEAILSLKVKEFLEDFDTVKAYCSSKEANVEDDRAGASLRCFLDDAVAGLESLFHYAEGIRTGDIKNWN